jgi:predicted O-methyltransferase YrrM
MEKNLDDLWVKSKNFKIQQKKNEWIPFIEYLLTQNQINHTLEIGCYDGGTTVFLSHITKNLITIDQPNPARFDTYGYNFGDNSIFGTKLINSLTNFNYISGDSHSEKTYNKVINALGENKLDLLFIDGDHSYEGVKKDFEMYSSLVREGGIIAFHDVHESSFHESHGCFVHNFWKEVQNNFEDKKIFYCDQDDNSVWGGIGVIIKN